MLETDPSFRPVRLREGYPPLEDLGLIGDGATVALVGLDGGIYWLCLPRFDSEPVFCALLDRQRGGHFTISPDELTQARQHYEPDTGVLVTELRSPTGLVRRAAITLKLCDHWVNGSLVAAPTSSLPAPVGGVRNWDYRYTWIRDAAFTVFALRRIGFGTEADAFLGWVLDAFEQSRLDRRRRPGRHRGGTGQAAGLEAGRPALRSGHWAAGWKSGSFPSPSLVLARCWSGWWRPGCVTPTSTPRPATGRSSRPRRSHPATRVWASSRQPVLALACTRAGSGLPSHGWGRHAGTAGTASVIVEQRQLKDVNTCVDDVLAGRVPARVVFSF
jgi:Domain of unknown function (DUF5911)/Glycosyl hydrolases family 15